MVPRTKGILAIIFKFACVSKQFALLINTWSLAVAIFSSELMVSVISRDQLIWLTACLPTRSLWGPLSTEFQFQDTLDFQFVHPSWCLLVNTTYLQSSETKTPVSLIHCQLIYTKWNFTLMYTESDNLGVWWDYIWRGGVILVGSYIAGLVKAFKPSLHS